MPSVREFLGSKCPSCKNDILQAAPSTNRMPGADLAWCPSCKSTLTAEQLARGGPRASGGLLGKLFGRPQRS